jgi:hypothetical protein
MMLHGPGVTAAAALPAAANMPRLTCQLAVTVTRTRVNSERRPRTSPCYATVACRAEEGHCRREKICQVVVDTQRFTKTWKDWDNFFLCVIKVQFTPLNRCLASQHGNGATQSVQFDSGFRCDVDNNSHSFFYLPIRLDCKNRKAWCIYSSVKTCSQGAI